MNLKSEYLKKNSKPKLQLVDDEYIATTQERSKSDYNTLCEELNEVSNSIQLLRSQIKRYKALKSNSRKNNLKNKKPKFQLIQGGK